MLLQTIARVRKRANRSLQIAGVIPTLYDTRTVQAFQSLQSITTSLEKIGAIYPPVPRTVAFADASQQHVPLTVYNPKHPAVAVLDTIAQGLLALA